MRGNTYSEWFEALDIEILADDLTSSLGSQINVLMPAVSAPATSPSPLPAPAPAPTSPGSPVRTANPVTDLFSLGASTVVYSVVSVTVRTPVPPV